MTSEAADRPRIYLWLASLGVADRPWARGYRPDAVVLPGGAPTAERRALVAALRSACAAPPGILVEFGPLDEDKAADELRLAMETGPDGIVLRGSVGLAGVEQLSARLAVQEAELDLPDGATLILPMVADSAAAALALPSLGRRLHPRLLGLGCDLGRLRSELGCREGAPALQAAAAAAVMTAAAIGVPAVAVPGPREPGQDPWACLDLVRAQGFRAVLLADAAELEAAREVFGAR